MLLFAGNFIHTKNFGHLEIKKNAIISVDQRTGQIRTIYDCKSKEDLENQIQDLADRNSIHGKNVSKEKFSNSFVFYCIFL